MESQSSDTVICRIYTARSIQLRHDTDIQRYTSSRSHDVTTASFWKNRVRAGFADGTMAAGWSEPDTKIKHHRSSNRQLQIQEAGSRRILHKTQLQGHCTASCRSKRQGKMSLKVAKPSRCGSDALDRNSSNSIPTYTLTSRSSLATNGVYRGTMTLGFFGWGEAFEPKVTNGSCCNVHSSFLTLTWCLWAAQKDRPQPLLSLVRAALGKRFKELGPKKQAQNHFGGSHTRIMLHDSHKFILMQTDFNTLRYFKILQDL